MILGSPINASAVKAAVLGTHAVAPGDEPSYTTGADGVVEVRLSVANARFTPSDVQIPAGKPVRLVVDRPDADPCSKELELPGLGIKRDLPDRGTATVDIPATDAGTFTMTCGMGMMSGRLLVGGGGAASGGMPGWAWILVLMAAIVGVAWLALGMRGTPRLVAEGGAPTAAPSPALQAKQAARRTEAIGSPARVKKKGARR
jgi:hypothetical protein